MKLTLVREKKAGESLHGRLYIDGVLFCDILERVGVEVPALWYTVSVSRSPRFGRLLPIVNRVPGRSGIRFHVGTLPRHSSGCLLVPSREREDRLTNLLLETQQKHETIYLEIISPVLPGDLYDVPCPARERMWHIESQRIASNYARQHSSRPTPLR